MQHQKLLEKLKGNPKTFPWKDVVRLLTALGYQKQEMPGSRVRFYHNSNKHMLRLHRPHPENHLKGGALKDLIEVLNQQDYFS
ncbi:type II toxin-antitoxin system HicA family toxin [Endozoicomonas sp. YOMI1]|uniref:type II toxin-antitoxin system HicA family toxin n=1 Tax=Endozoicomonas sp. YOMI1 TaxID=2828739 RepID=UPI0021479F8D|nr:type II toxin-antitoxin system HicA family toxin [Endozoicomonas sp. YOMI1]